MRAFISYSLVDRELYIISLLSKKLRNDGYDLQSRLDLHSHTLDFNTRQKISSSQLFIGIISYNGLQRNRVLQEWQYATNNKIPAVLLIEENVQIAPGADRNSYIRFNRHDPQPAIDKIQQRMSSKKDNEEAAGWILAGAALLAIVALFSSSKK